MPVRDSLDDYSKYQAAKKKHPASAELARKILQHCTAKHGAQLRWPAGSTGWIVSEPNYFTFGTINQTQTSVMVDIMPVGRGQYVGSNGVTEEAAQEVRLRDVVDRVTGYAKRTRFDIVDEDQLSLACQILDRAFALSEPKFERQGIR